MTHDQMIEVILAHRRGEAIEWRWGDSIDGGTEWRPTDEPEWDFADREYRVSPSQQRRYTRWATVCTTETGKTEYLSGLLYLSKEEAERGALPGRFVRAIKMVEASDAD